jgi:hypothetical protein
MKKNLYQASVIFLFFLMFVVEITPQKRFDFGTIKQPFARTLQSKIKKDTIPYNRDLFFRPQIDGLPLTRNLLYEPAKDGKANVLLLSHDMYKAHEAVLTKSLALVW